MPQPGFRVGRRRTDATPRPSQPAFREDTYKNHRCISDHLYQSRKKARAAMSEVVGRKDHRRFIAQRYVHPSGRRPPWRTAAPALPKRSGENSARAVPARRKIRTRPKEDVENHV